MREGEQDWGGGGTCGQSPKGESPKPSGAKAPRSCSCPSPSRPRCALSAPPAPAPPHHPSPRARNHTWAEASEWTWVGPAPAESGRGPSVWRGGGWRSRDPLDVSSLGASHREGRSRSHGASCVLEGRSPSSSGTLTPGLERLRGVRPPQIKVSAGRLCSSPHSRARPPPSVAAGALTRRWPGSQTTLRLLMHGKAWLPLDGP